MADEVDGKNNILLSPMVSFLLSIFSVLLETHKSTIVVVLTRDQQCATLITTEQQQPRQLYYNKWPRRRPPTSSSSTTICQLYYATFFLDSPRRCCVACLDYYYHWHCVSLDLSLDDDINLRINKQCFKVWHIQVSGAELEYVYCSNLSVLVINASINASDDFITIFTRI